MKETQMEHLHPEAQLYAHHAESLLENAERSQKTAPPAMPKA